MSRWSGWVLEPLVQLHLVSLLVVLGGCIGAALMQRGATQAKLRFVRDLLLTTSVLLIGSITLLVQAQFAHGQFAPAGTAPNIFDRERCALIADGMLVHSILGLIGTTVSCVGVLLASRLGSGAE